MQQDVKSVYLNKQMQKGTTIDEKVYGKTIQDLKKE